MRLSVVVPSRRRPALLHAALASVGTQTRPPDEVVVVNDGGPVADAPFAELRAVAAPCRLRVTCLGASVGHVAARTLAVSMTAGEAVALLDDDDLWLTDHAADLLAALDAGADLAYSDAELVYVDRAAGLPMPVLGRRLFALDADPAFARRYNPVVPSAMALRRDLYERLGGFRAASGHHWDWDFLLRAIAAGARIQRVARATIVYTLDRGGGNQSARAGEMRDSVRALARRHGLASDAVHTFWTMLDEPDVAGRLAASERPWSGAWPGVLAAATRPRRRPD
jgi:glycosyltransferase involved in cell wall biosynthesis